MNIISDIYQMESDEAEKNLKKKIRNKKKPIKRKIIIEFFLHYFFYQNNTTFTFQPNKKSNNQLGENHVKIH